jgi:chaperonin GroEL
VEEGIVPGGGVAYLRTLPALEKIKLPEAQQFGLNILRKALEEPIRWIAMNAGFDGSIVVEKVKNEKGNFGFDAQNEEYTDMVKAGIIDPTKVVRTALQNASSISSLMLTTEAMVCEIPEKRPAGPPQGGGHDHGMDY